jgi:hypothetical protein
MNKNLTRALISLVRVIFITSTLLSLGYIIGKVETYNKLDRVFRLTIGNSYKLGCIEAKAPNERGQCELKKNEFLESFGGLL